MFGKEKPNNYVYYGYSGQMMHQVPTGQQWNQQHVGNRNQPIPYQAQPQNYEWMSFQQQNPYYPQGMQPFAQNYQPGFVPQTIPYPNQTYSQKDSQFLFQNPLQPKDEMVQQPSYMPMNGYPMMNPYPKQNMLPKQPGGVKSIMNSFKSQDGSVDFNKMVNTAGTMMNAVNQVSSLVKGFGGFFKA
ncbi:YppG family protein [Neobacillus sp. OS1-2]|uniref:YppG family protein n=1 Tax=Neobacillus sp. OS1-2 TaxID=3070680 RepID=UPI0027E124B2|nr:YppG family protein [Neobacillus sp. OS1-2]WML40333.1 YppG family protein [Neobacillus sp. OS1-2]